MSEPVRPAPLVVNWKEHRIAGMPAQLTKYAGRTWLVSDQHALSADWVGPSEIVGDWLSCDPDAGKAEPYVAVPLAPTAASPRGFVETARLPGETSRATARPTLDLSLQRRDLIVVARGAGGARWLHVSPSRDGLTEVGHLPALLGDDYNDVAAIDERYVAVASRLRGVIIVDAADPSAPQVIADGLPHQLPRDGHSVFVSEGRLYLAQAPAVGTGSVTAFDMRKPTAPRQLWRWQADAGHDAHDVTARREYIYVSSIRGGSTVLQAKGDSMPEVVARRRGLAAHSCSVLERKGSNHAVSERVLWGEERLGGGLHLVDVERTEGQTSLVASRLGSLNELDSSNDDASIAFAASPHNSECAGSTCFVAHYQLGLRVFELGSLASVGDGALTIPVVAEYPTWRPGSASESMWLRGASGVALDLPWVYVADTDEGVLLLRYDPPAATAPEQSE